MSRFTVTILNSKNPMGAKVVELAQKRIDELRDNPYKRMFEAENCDNPAHADYQNKVTLDMGTSMMELDCCCLAFDSQIRRLVGGE